MKRSRIGLVVLVSLSLAAACTSKKDKQGAKPVTIPTAKPTAPDGKPTRGGHIILPTNEPRYLNPILETRFNRANVLLFEGLVGLDAKLDPVPRLAEKYDVAADGKTITFTLRKGVKWHDGNPVTSADVAFTFSAIKETTANILWKAYFASVESVSTPDEHTVVVKYSVHYAPALVIWTVGIIPKHIYGGDLVKSKGNTEPVGSGPYKLARWEPGKRILLSANESYWNGRPNIDSIELVIGVKNRLEALREGKLDFTDIPDIASWISDAQLPDFRAQFEVGSVVGSLFRLIAWNTQKAPFDNRKVRLALTLALNRSRIVDDVLLGQAQPLGVPFFPNMRPGADPKRVPHPFDLDRAVKLLDEAGFPKKEDGRFDIKILTLNSQRQPLNEEMFAIFRRDLSAIGIGLKVEYVSGTEFANQVLLREFDAVFLGWLPDIPDPDPSPLLHSSQINIGQNFAGYANAEVDALLEQAAATSNRDERKPLYHKLHAKLHEDLPYTVLYAPYKFYAWNRRLRGVNPEDIGPQPRFPGIGNWWVSGSSTK